PFIRFALRDPSGDAYRLAIALDPRTVPLRPVVLSGDIAHHFRPALVRLVASAIWQGLRAHLPRSMGEHPRVFLPSIGSRSGRGCCTDAPDAFCDARSIAERLFPHGLVQGFASA